MDSIDQVIHAFLQPVGWTGEAVVRLSLAGIIGAVIGLEREWRGREAGFRTNLLVCLGSALVMLVSMQLAEMPWKAIGAYNINVDPGRIAYGVMTGIGFLGAGAILKTDHTVRGLTTAAGMWCVAAIGLAVGMGAYALSTLAAGLVLGALWVLHYVEHRIPRQHFRKFVIRCPWESGCIATLSQRLVLEGGRVVGRGFCRVGDLTRADVVLSVAFSDADRGRAAEERLVQDPRYEVISCEPS
jgi:putative Mg2+ transporter-C (MgtC) family protein